MLSLYYFDVDWVGPLPSLVTSLWMDEGAETRHLIWSQKVSSGRVHLGAEFVHCYREIGSLFDFRGPAHLLMAFWMDGEA